MRIFVDHIKYHRQNEAEFPTWHRELRVSSLRDSCRSSGLLPLGGNFCFHLDDQFCQFLFAFFLAVGVDISRKAVAVGFEWPDEAGVWAKVAEEIEEFKEAESPEDRELEFGDILFALVNVARWNGVDAENALRATCAKFRRRWSFMEAAAWARGERLEDLSTDEQEELWQQAKAHEREVAEAREA